MKCSKLFRTIIILSLFLYANALFAFDLYAGTVITESGISKKRFLYISSYGDNRRSNVDFSLGIKSVLTGRAENEVYYVDFSPKYPNDEEEIATKINLIKSIFADGKPDVVIVSENSALEFVRSSYDSYFKGIPIVLCAVCDYNPEMTGEFEQNVYASNEPLPVDATIQCVSALFPDTKNLYFINDFTNDGAAARNEIETIAKDYENIINFDFNDIISFEALLNEVSSLPDNTVVITGKYYIDGNGESYTEMLSQQLLSEQSNSPIFGLSYSTAGFGQIGGKYFVPYDMGANAAVMAQAIADGAKPSETPPQSQWAFDGSILKKYDLDSASLAQKYDAEILNSPLAAKEAHINIDSPIWIFVSAAISLAFIFACLYAVHRKNKQLAEAMKGLENAQIEADKEPNWIKSKKIYEKVLHNAPIMYILIVNGFIKESNRYSQELIGMNPGDEITQFYYDPNEWKKLLHALETTDVLTSEVIQVIMIDRQVNRFIMNITKMSTENGVGLFVWGINIERSERQRDSIERTQRNMEKLIDALPVPLFILDPMSLALVYGNKTFADLFGYESMDSLVGRSVTEILPEQQEDGTDSIVSFRDSIDKVIESSAPVEMEVSNVTLTGEPIALKAILTSFVYKGISSILVIKQDISAQKKQSQMLLKIAESEKEANLLKSRFIVNMSHEIRTPMNAIIGLSEIEIAKARDKESYDSFRKINSSAKNLLAIVNDILDFSKIEAEKLELSEESFNIEEAMSEALNVASHRIADKDVEMTANISGDLPSFLLGDKTRVWQILKNLLENAAKYTKTGSILLNAKVNGTDEFGRINVVFEITDTGCGMSETHVNKLFTPFEQFNENKLKSHGTGLGASITKQLVELMGGNISVESVPDKGTSFVINIPFKQAPNASTINELSKRESLAGKSALIVDDSFYVRDSLEAFLSSIGMMPTCVSGAKDALEIISQKEEANEKFDIILLDFMLGSDNGITLAERIKRIASGNQKFILITAYSKRLLPNDIEQIGFLSIIEKPFVPSVLVESLCGAFDIGYESDDDFEKAKFMDAKVLLCEDNFINQDVAMGILEMFGIEPMIAENGKEAIDMLEAGEAFDLILMDILMPVMSGHEATEIIRASEKPYKDVPIVAMTANAMSEEINKCYEEGMNGHISKPIEVDKVYVTLMKYLSHKAVRSDADAGLQKSENGIYIEGIDTADGMKRFANKIDKYEKALKSFAEETERTLPVITDAFAENNIREARNQVHKLKGIAGNLGAMKMYEFASNLENLLTDGSADTFVLGKFKKSAQTTVDNLNAYFDSKFSFEGEILQRPEGDDSEAIALLNELKTALDEFDPTRSDGLIEKLRAKKWETIDIDKINAVADLIENYEYEEANLTIDELFRKELSDD